MSPRVKRKIYRWLHMLAGSVVLTYVYSPLKEHEIFHEVVAYGVIPLVMLSGLVLWTGIFIKK